MRTVEPNERVTFAVRHEDEHLVVVEKPARVVSTPGVGHQHDTLLNGLYARWGETLRHLGEKRDHGMVHRLDRDTSGLLVVAKSAAVYDALRAAFAGRRVEKYYWAICLKAPREPRGVVRKAIEERVERTSKYTAVKTAKPAAAGKPAVTAYRVLDESPLAALIEARPVTGRLHQVRVHLAMIGAGVLGDGQYGPVRTNRAAPRLALHAHRLRLDHPATGDPLDVRTAFPKDLRRTLRALELRRPDLPAAEGGIPASGSAEEGHEVRGDAVGEAKPRVCEDESAG